LLNPPRDPAIASRPRCTPTMIFLSRGIRPLCLSLAILSMALMVSGCRDMKPSDVEMSAEAAVVVIPGYYGTRLVEQTRGRLVWLSVREALFGTRSLAAQSSNLGIQNPVLVRPDGILEDIPVIPFLYSIKGYGTLLKMLRNLGPRTRIVPSAYDWRMDLLDAVENLDKTIERLRNQGVRRIALVAHSMGGLVAAYYLRYGTQQPDQAVETWVGASQVDAVVLAGVPYHGSMRTFRNMQYGRSVGLNTMLLTAEAVSSFPASYYLLPAPGSDVLLSRSSEKLVGLLYRSDHWTKYEWGLLRNGTGLSDVTIGSRRSYTERWLGRAKRFFELLHRPAEPTSRRSIPLLDVRGMGFETLAAGFWLGTDSPVAKGLLFDKEQVHEFDPSLDHSLLLADGDGTVTASSASLPSAYRAMFVVDQRTVEVSHNELVTDSRLLEQVSSFLATTLARP
jgi:pimeloyl-ACP methyl ester carboxylesterase